MTCPHTTLNKVIDRLGMMTEQPDGMVSAPVLEAHYECAACGQVARTTVNEQAQQEYDGLALLSKLRAVVETTMAALTAVHEYRERRVQEALRVDRPKEITDGK